jgi:AraC-like DNA-binding protein
MVVILRLTGRGALPTLSHLMSIVRHPQVRGYAVVQPPGRSAIPVERGWDQLLCTVTGAMTVRAADDAWVVPALRALWLPGGARATVQTRGRAGVRALYLDESLRRLPEHPQVLTLTPLARELVARIVRECPLDPDDPSHAALLTVLLDELGGAETSSLHLPAPTDPRARNAAAALLDDPAVALADRAREVGASRRTLERRFSAETGLTLAAWQRRARVLRALELLAGGTTVTATALAVGYATPSSFVAAFRAETGSTPGAFRPKAGDPTRNA